MSLTSYITYTTTEKLKKKREYGMFPKGAGDLVDDPGAGGTHPPHAAAATAHPLILP